MSVLRYLPAALSIALLAACGGGGGGGPAPSGDGVGAGGTGLQAAQEGDLVAYARNRIQESSARGQSLIALSAASAPPPIAAAAIGQAPSQEAGVAEEDLLQADRQTVYALHPWTSWESPARAARLTTHRINADGSLSGLATVTLASEFRTPAMHLAPEADRLVVLGEVDDLRDPAAMATQLTTIWPSRRRMLLDVYDTSGAGAPRAATRLEISGTLVGSRRVGNTLYLASTWVPDLGRYVVPAGSSASQVQAALAGLTAQELLPTVRVDGGTARPLVAESDCLLQPRNASTSLQLTTITAIDLTAPATRRASRCFVGGSSALYMTQDSVYLASSEQYSDDAFIASFPPRFPATARTDIHKFGLRGLQLDYRGSGRVQGHLGWDREKAPYRMGEHEGLLRVLTFTGETGWFGPQVTSPANAPSPATLTVLREDAASRSLVEVAKLPNARRPEALGKAGEQVYAVRFAGPRAYLVTFRQTDPLYVLDLADASDPQVAGELTIPGFSDYLFPLADGKLLGVGKDATAQGLLQGVKVGLFDVANPTQPRVLSTLSLGARGSTSGLDYARRGISLLAQDSQVRVALPVRLYEPAASSAPRLSRQGLAQFQIDTVRGTLVEQPMVAATRFDGSAADAVRLAQYDLSRERSLLTPQATYYLTGGELRHIARP
jgi:hypothetical protein